MQPLPRELLEGWEADIVETTALGDSVVSRTPTGHVETCRVADSEDIGNDAVSKAEPTDE